MKPQDLIKTPCQENWDAMTPVKEGKFCQQCAFVVTDLTQATTQQVIDFLKNASQKVCIRVKNKLSIAQKFQYKEYLYTKLYQFANIPLKTYFYKRSMLLGASFLGLVLGFSSCKESSKPQSSTTDTIIQATTGTPPSFEDTVQFEKPPIFPPLEAKIEGIADITGTAISPEVYIGHTMGIPPPPPEPPNPPPLSNDTILKHLIQDSLQPLSDTLNH